MLRKGSGGGGERAGGYVCGCCGCRSAVGGGEEGIPSRRAPREESRGCGIMKEGGTCECIGDLRDLAIQASSGRGRRTGFEAVAPFEGGRVGDRGGDLEVVGEVLLSPPVPILVLFVWLWEA